MKKLLFLLIMFCNVIVYAQNNFTIKYSFTNDVSSEVIEGGEGITAANMVAGGTKLGATQLVTDGGIASWQGEIVNNNNSNSFTHTFLRFDISPKAGYMMNVESISIKQKRTGRESGPFYVRIGCSKNGLEPTSGTYPTLSKQFAWPLGDYANCSFEPVEGNSTDNSVDYISVWASGRGSTDDIFNWDVDEVTITGTYTSISEYYTIKVSDQLKQQLQFGIDAERLWYWRPYMADKLAELGVKELKSDYVRVAINCSYEREEGVKNPDSYNEILDMMAAMKTANPAIKFFASPRPLFESYSNEEVKQIWGGKCPWSPYPAWILTFSANGTDTDGNTKWKQDQLFVDKLVQYYADYLNFMKTKGYDIEYLDLVNENSVMNPAIGKQIYDGLPSKLNAGVHLPELINNSSWNVQGAINFLDNLDKSKDEHLAFDIASTHNTGSGGDPATFVTKANNLNKEVWNTELHDWVGVDLKDEILTSKVFWQYLRAGFTGIDTWLFYGPYSGKGHTMLWSHWQNGDVIKSGKYEIFKQVVNNANGGNYLDVSMISEAMPTAAFIKYNVLSVWVLNTSTSDIPGVTIQFANKDLSDKTVEVVTWNKAYPRSGNTSSFTMSQKDGFTTDIKAESLYFFKMNLNQATAVAEYKMLKDADIKLFPNPARDSFTIAIPKKLALLNPDYNVVNMNGKWVEHGKIRGANSRINTHHFDNGIYLVQVQTKDQVFSEKIRILK